MDKWEYRILLYTKDGFEDNEVWVGELEEQLNALGTEGWEAIAAGLSANSFCSTRVLFKRPRTPFEEMKKEAGL